MNENVPVATTTDFKDRRGGLIAFGIVLILLGCLCVLVTAITLVTVAGIQNASGFGAFAGPGTFGYRQVLTLVLTYGGLATALIWLGIGSIVARRWARSLVLILSWLWLATGVITTVGAAMFLPRMLSSPTSPGGQPMPDGMRMGAMFVTTGCLGVFFVVLPIAFVLFYRSRHVKATCEARDPTVRWTDACPPQVLGLSVALAAGTVSFPFMMVINRPVVPCFGMLLGGAPAIGTLLAMAAGWGYCTWATYRMKPEGWWTLLVLFALSTASSLLTFWRVDFVEMYRMMDYPEEQIAQIKQSGLISSHDMVIGMAIGSLLMFGYLLYVKKYFRRNG